jgi:hypothetical protein
VSACFKLALPEFAWMAENKTAWLAWATCSAKCMIRADWSRVGGLKVQLPPMQAKAFQVARRITPVAQMSFASQVALARQSKGRRIELPMDSNPSKLRKTLQTAS